MGLEIAWLLTRVSRFCYLSDIISCFLFLFTVDVGGKFLNIV